MPLPDDPLHQTLSDGGPRYVETVDLSAPIVEPWNTASAFLFVVLVLIWMMRLWGRFRQYPFLTCCLPILFVGGIGGTLYHATRASRLYHMLDIGPITLLGLFVSLYLWWRLGARRWHLIGIVLVYIGLNDVIFRTLPIHFAISFNYGLLAILIVGPIIMVLVRTHFHEARWFWTALVCFGMAIGFRLLDAVRPAVLPMGTHWLWHLFGVLTTAALSEYLYCLESRFRREK